jgi:hypothetical protein
MGVTVRPLAAASGGRHFRRAAAPKSLPTRLTGRRLRTRHGSLDRCSTSRDPEPAAGRPRRWPRQWRARRSPRRPRSRRQRPGYTSRAAPTRRRRRDRLRHERGSLSAASMSAGVLATSPASLSLGRDKAKEGRDLPGSAGPAGLAAGEFIAIEAAPRTAFSRRSDGQGVAVAASAMERAR